MNTNTIRTNIEWPTGKTSSAAETWNAIVPLNKATLFSTRVLMATVPALAIIVAATWAVGSAGTASILQAAMWASGFVFLALAIETSKPNITGLLLTGLALPVLALLSAHVASEFAIIAATLVAGWVAASIMSLQAK